MSPRPSPPKRMSTKETLVVIVGAGASVAAGIQSTRELNKIAQRALPTLHLLGTSYVPPSFDGKAPMSRFDKTIPMADILDSALRADYKEYDFEVLLHALEQLETFTTNRYVSARDANRFVIGSFAEIMRQYEPLNDSTLIHEARWAVTTAIHAAVGSTSEYPIAGAEAPRARDQLNRMFTALAKEFRLVVIDFNYDNILDKVGVEWEDGFSERVPDHFCSLFSPTHWAAVVNDSSKHLLMHVHGSVHYAFKPRDLHTLTTAFSEPAKYDYLSKAQEIVQNTRTGGTTVDGQVYDGGVIISGLGKAGKIAYNARPYGYYHQAIVSIVPFARRLLVLGYGWRDTHVNTWIDEMVDMQRDRLSAVVTYRPGILVGDNMSIEYQRLGRLAGPRTWGSLETSAFLKPSDPSYPKFFSEDEFAIVPGGFVLDDDTENQLLEFISK